MASDWIVRIGEVDHVFILVSDQFLVEQMYAQFRPSDDYGQKFRDWDKQSK